MNLADALSLVDFNRATFNHLWTNDKNEPLCFLRSARTAEGWNFGFVELIALAAFAALREQGVPLHIATTAICRNWEDIEAAASPTRNDAPAILGIFVRSDGKREYIEPGTETLDWPNMTAVAAVNVMLIAERLMEGYRRMKHPSRPHKSNGAASERQEP